MALLDKLKQNIETAGQFTAEKAKKAAELLKLKEQIRQDKKEIRDLTYKIGQIYVELHKDDYEEAYEEYFIALEALELSISKKQKELKKMNEQDSCMECGTPLSSSNNYCPNCGTPAAYDTELKEEEKIEEDIFQDDYEEADTEE